MFLHSKFSVLLTSFCVGCATFRVQWPTYGHHHDARVHHPTIAGQVQHAANEAELAFVTLNFSAVCVKSVSANSNCDCKQHQQSEPPKWKKSQLCAALCFEFQDNKAFNIGCRGQHSKAAYSVLCGQFGSHKYIICFGSHGTGSRELLRIGFAASSSSIATHTPGANPGASSRGRGRLQTGTLEFGACCSWHARRMLGRAKHVKAKERFV